jgi:hypothetical protein
VKDDQIRPFAIPALTQLLDFAALKPAHRAVSTTNLRSGQMTKDEIRTEIQDDIEYFRTKAKYYKAHYLFEAAGYAEKLASNLELALTTMPSDDDPEIA